MYELVKLTENDYYIDCPSKIGIVKISDTDVVLIDSGSDRDAAKKVLKATDSNGWKIKAIFVTHSHADHIGGNAFLQEKTGCKIYSSGLERAFCENPMLEPMCLFGGEPFEDLKGKFLLAKESEIDELTADVLPFGFEIIDLPGHCFNMVGLLTPDGTAYIGDALSSQSSIEKYAVNYLWDINEALKTLEKLGEIRAERFVPSHCEVTSDITPLARLNIEKINEIKDKITEFCSAPIAAEELMKKLFDFYSLSMNPIQYVLVGSTVKSYLSCLYSDGRITFEFSDNRMLWKAV